MNVSDSPTVPMVLIAAMGVNLLTDIVDFLQGKRTWKLFSGFFNWKKLADFRAIAIKMSCLLLTDPHVLSRRVVK